MLYEGLGFTGFRTRWRGAPEKILVHRLFDLFDTVETKGMMLGRSVPRS